MTITEFDDLIRRAIPHIKGNINVNVSKIPQIPHLVQYKFDGINQIVLYPDSTNNFYTMPSVSLVSITNDRITIPMIKVIECFEQNKHLEIT